MVLQSSFAEVGIEGMEIIAKGEAAHFSGKVQFHPNLKHLKWQKYRNDRYIDIEIRNQKYHGSTNELRNPKLEIHNVDSDDETKYRLEVKTDLSTIHSNAISLRVILHPGKNPVCVGGCACVRARECIFIHTRNNCIILEEFNAL